jgi:hypothetical protein
VEEAIEAAPDKRLRFVLLALIRKQPAAKDFMSRHLTLPITGAKNKKRKAYEVCANCDMDYYVAGNGKGICTYHVGKCGRLS